MNVDRSTIGFFRRCLWYCSVPPNRYVLNVKVKVLTIRSSRVPSSSSEWSSLTESDITTWLLSFMSLNFGCAYEQYMLLLKNTMKFDAILSMSAGYFATTETS